MHTAVVHKVPVHSQGVLIVVENGVGIELQSAAQCYRILQMKVRVFTDSKIIKSICNSAANG